MKKVPKSSALYIHFPKGVYECDDCIFYGTDKTCLLVKGVIDPKAVCGYFVGGERDTFRGKSLGIFTKVEAGYVEKVNGASCGRCEYFNPDGDCFLVDKDSPGDDPGKIHPKACCSLWEEK